MFIIKRTLALIAMVKDDIAKKKAHPNIFKTVTLLKYEQATTEVSLIYLAIGSKGGICERILRIDFHYKRKV